MSLKNKTIVLTAEAEDRLRNMFAMMAMGSYIESYPSNIRDEVERAQIGEFAFLMADAMLKERAGGGKA